jgi:hypothetical protein
MIIISRLLLVFVMVGLYFLLDYSGKGFVLGFITALILAQTAYKSRHGKWFDLA